MTELSSNVTPQINTTDGPASQLLKAASAPLAAPRRQTAKWGVAPSRSANAPRANFLIGRTASPPPVKPDNK